VRPVPDDRADRRRARGRVRPEVKIVKINTDENANVAKPTDFGHPDPDGLQDGELVDRLVGAAPKATIKAMVDRQLA